MALKLNSASGSITLTAEDGSGNVDISIPRAGFAATDPQLTDLAGLTPSDGEFIVGDGSNFVTESGATARTSLGLGSTATQDSTAVSFTGGSIDGTTIGGTTPDAVTGTTVTATTGFMPDANDGAYLGQSGTAFSDLFLASGGVIDWNAGDVTITHSANALDFAGGQYSFTNGALPGYFYNSAAAAANNTALQLRWTSSPTAGDSGDLDFTNAAGATLARLSNVVVSGSELDLDLYAYNSGLVKVMSLGGDGDVSIPNGSISDEYGNLRDVPTLGTATGSYTLQASDAGRMLEIGTGGSITVPTGVFGVGDVVTIVNQTSSTASITTSAVTAYISGDITAKSSITLDGRGLCTLLFTDTAVVYMSGNIS